MKHLVNNIAIQNFADDPTIAANARYVQTIGQTVNFNDNRPRVIKSLSLRYSFESDKEISNVRAAVKLINLSGGGIVSNVPLLTVTPQDVIYQLTPDKSVNDINLLIGGFGLEQIEFQNGATAMIGAETFNWYVIASFYPYDNESEIDYLI